MNFSIVCHCTSIVIVVELGDKEALQTTLYVSVYSSCGHRDLLLPENNFHCTQHLQHGKDNYPSVLWLVAIIAKGTGTIITKSYNYYYELLLQIF